MIICPVITCITWLKDEQKHKQDYPTLSFLICMLPLVTVKTTRCT